MQQFIKKMLINHFPDLVVAYRHFRFLNQMRSSSAVPTPYGFAMTGNEKMQKGGFETHEAELIRMYAGKFDVFVDIGANIGFYSCLVRNMGKPVIAVEPCRNNLAILLANLRTNDFLDTEVYPVGLSDHPGILQLYGEDTGASFLKNWAGQTDRWNEAAPVTTLDNLLGRRFDEKKLFIKIDVEGFEYEVLKGAEDTLRMAEAPFWLVEVCLREHHPSGINPHFESVFRIFREYGYKSFSVGHALSLVNSEQVIRWVEGENHTAGSINYFFVKSDDQESV